MQHKCSSCSSQFVSLGESLARSRMNFLLSDPLIPLTSGEAIPILALFFKKEI